VIFCCNLECCLFSTFLCMCVCCTGVIRRDNRSSRMHSDYRSDQQQQQPPDESHIRYFFAAFRSMLDHKPKQQPKESAGNDPNQSRFERVTETLHRSTTWRPPPIFFPIASAVTLIGAVIGTSVGVTWLYIASRYVCLTLSAHSTNLFSILVFETLVFLL